MRSDPGAQDPSKVWRQGICMYLNHWIHTTRSMGPKLQQLNLKDVFVKKLGCRESVSGGRIRGGGIGGGNDVCLKTYCKQ